MNDIFNYFYDLQTIDSKFTPVNNKRLIILLYVYFNNLFSNQFYDIIYYSVITINVLHFNALKLKLNINSRHLCFNEITTKLLIIFNVLDIGEF